MTEPVVEVTRFGDLDTSTLYSMLRLRVDVFVVEQRCPYPELDGHDTETSTEHVLAHDGAQVAGYLRLLSELDGSRRIGRVCVARGHRGRGLAARLVSAALSRCAGDVVVLDAQVYLRNWYVRHGSVASGPEFLEDGIPHVPMRLQTSRRVSRTPPTSAP